jgi:hypothetical protein
MYGGWTRVETLELESPWLIIFVVDYEFLGISFRLCG